MTALTHARRGSPRGRVFLALVLALLAASAVYELLFTLNVFGYGPRGQSPPGEELVLWAAAGVVFAGFVVLVAATLPRMGGLGDRALLPWVSLLAGAIVVIRYYGPDAYLLNVHGSVADGGTVTSTQILAPAGLCVVAAAVSRSHPRAGLVLTALAVWFSVGTFSHEGFGH